MIQMEMRKKNVDNILRKPGADNFFSQVPDAGTRVNDADPVCSFAMDLYTGCASPISFKLFAAYGQRTPHSVKFDFHLPNY